LFAAIDAWSLGDFSKFIVDSVGDEISQFAERLNSMAKQLQELLRRRQEMAVSEERNRLARDLHDSAKQQALAASFELGTALTLFECDPGKARQHLVEADSLVDSVRKELTNLVDELRPHPTDGRDLAEVVRDTVEDWSQRSGIESEVNIEGEEKPSPAIEETLLRILQEGLANIARHSAASKVKVTLLNESKKVTIIIKDNGCGFNPQKVYEGLGLSSMKERAEALGGNFMVSSQPGQGTVLTVILPNEEVE
jgi:NarL family two-component system sensor histidine kinase LiaS